jgi:hypothetical protein
MNTDFLGAGEGRYLKKLKIFQKFRKGEKL